MKVNDKNSVGVRISKEGMRDVNLWFDKKSLHLLKYDFRGLDPMSMMEVNQEKYLSGYKAIMGIQTPSHIEVHHDGKKTIDMDVTEMRYHEKLDDTHFARP